MKIMRWLFRWVLYLFVVLVVLAVAGVLLLNTIVKQVVESRLRASTGMDTRIGLIDVGLLSPTLTIENFKLYNTADFGGSVFIDMPELHLEYDPVAIGSGKLHFKLVRLDLAEIAVVQDKKGRLNVQDLQKKNRAAASAGTKSSATDLKFTGIDTFNLTLGKFRLSNLASGREEEIEFGIKNQISHNVRSEADLGGLNLLLANRALSVSSSTNPTLDLPALLQSLTAH
jgi:uncharacterized protein involved in outer membrane biogenesis